MNFIEIVTPDQTFEHIVRADDGTPMDVQLHLRIVDDEKEKEIRRGATGKPRFERGQRYEPFDATKFIGDVLDYAIVGWRGVRSQGRELPCDRAIKLLLPEKVKTEVIRLCLGKEAGEVVAAEAMPDEKKS